MAEPVVRAERVEASIVIPSWNGASILKPTLEKLRSLEGVAWEALVVDHGRLNRETETLVSSLGESRIRYVGEDQQLGFTGAVNRGVREARADWIVVMCNDVLVEKNWLKALVDEARTRKNAGSQPVLFSAVQRSETPVPSRMNLWFRVVPGETPDGRFFHPDGSSFLFSRSRYGEPFDEDFFLYQEDVYLGWRAWLMGEGVHLVPASRAVNFDGGTTRRTPYRTSFFTERNRWLNYLLFLSWGAFFQVLPLLALDAGIKFLAGSNRLAKLHAWAWILLHLPSILCKRAPIQRLRNRPDDEILSLLSGRFLPGKSGLNKIFYSLARLLGLRLA